MVFERLANSNDYKLNNKHHALAANFTLLQQSNTLHSYIFILCTHSKCLVMLLTLNFHWILSAALRLVNPTGCINFRSINCAVSVLLKLFFYYLVLIKRRFNLLTSCKVFIFLHKITCCSIDKSIDKYCH